MDILGLFDRVEQVLDAYFPQFPLRKASGAIRKYYKRPLGNMRVVSALFSIVHWCPLLSRMLSAQMAGVAHTIHCDSRRALGGVPRSARKGRIYYDFT